MALDNHKDAFMCKVFLTSLTGVTLEWFKNRPHKSIQNYETLCAIFLAQYCSNKKQKKTIAGLFAIRQKRGKMLQDFLSRYNMEASEIADCHPKIVVEAFKIGMIQGTKFHTSLVKYSPLDMQTLNAKVQIYIRLKENVAHRAQHATLVTVENKPREKLQVQKVKEISMPQHQLPKYLRHKTEERVTPLRTTLARLFQENKVENMIARGDLADYLRQKEHTRSKKVNTRKVEGNQVKVIHAIHGKSEEDQESEEVYRSRLRAVHKLRKLSLVNTITSGSISIGFRDRDLSRVQLPHEDPLIISLLVANCMIQKVLVDPGSSANIITKVAFE
ncbi:uncharacterized protein LOC132270061 [Cornus florida]|uniref:uncharacterized protein LOC132270061 n=1 Tax=Cornus florida TaxID=4283 RepID=UPI00289B8B1D|nr:uncharacterized protein LOC132270061 [Cornus florida]